MDTDSDLDFISELPQSIVETILTKLPIREAVKTSILSTRWRYKWASLTHLVFDNQSVPNDQAVNQDKIINFITRCLFLHEGPVHKFSLSISYLNTSPNIDQWLLFISRKGIKELIIDLGEGEWFRVPYSVFSCMSLTHLVLSRCELDLHPDFRGFPCLKYLNLQEVSISPDYIEFLISSCPILESLTLSYFDGMELTLHAPNLKYLVLEGEFKDLCLESTPLLVSISFAMYLTDDITEHLEQSSCCNFEKLLGGVPKLERLTGRIYFTKFMSLGNDEIHNPITFHHLKTVELYQVGFDDSKEVIAMLQILVNSPNLETLHISNAAYVYVPTEEPDLEVVWDDESFADCTFHRLRTMKMTDVCGGPHEMKFLEFMLKRSPNLEVMSIVPSIHVKEGRLDMLIHLVSFRRASTQATISYARSPV